MKINLIANMNGVLIGLSYSAETVITIGREVGNTIAPLAADGLSRHHAKIFEKDGKWYVEDLGSTNGSYRLGQKIEGAVELQVRDMLQFGKLEISVDEIAADGGQPVAAAAAEPAPAPAPAAVAPAPSPAPAITPAAAAPAPTPAPVMTPAAAAAAGAASARRPTLPGIKPGIKLPQKPVIGAGVKLPPKPTLAAGLKLPPKPTLAAGLKLPPKPGAAPAAKPTAPVSPLEPVAELTPVE